VNTVQTLIPAVTSLDRLIFTLFVAGLLHAMVILGVTFTAEEYKPAPRPNALDVILVQTQSDEAPEKADFVAQANQQGSGQSEQKARPTKPVSSPLPLPLEGVSPTPPTKATPKTAKRQKHPTLLTTRRSERKVRSKPEKSAKDKTTPSTQELINRALQMAALSSEISNQQHIYAKRPYIRDISAVNTIGVNYAAYMDAWVKKVERIGNLNYPDEARRKRLSGRLILAVSLRPDGSIHSIDLIRSSGQQVLDDAAIRIVKLASPFAKFPKNIRSETDILRITRTWEFLSNNQLMGR